jgi:hypothetical protein
MTLKPRLSNSVGMLFGGCVLAWFGFRVAVYLGGYLAILPGVVGVLGVFWLGLGVLALARRSRLSIFIDESGIEVPAFRLYQRGSPRVRISREDITAVSKHEAMKGRLIEISTTSRGPVLLQARHYCELEDFISHCRRYGLPVA